MLGSSTFDPAVGGFRQTDCCSRLRLPTYPSICTIPTNRRFFFFFFLRYLIKMRKCKNSLTKASSLLKTSKAGDRPPSELYFYVCGGVIFNGSSSFCMLQSNLSLLKVKLTIATGAKIWPTLSPAYGSSNRSVSHYSTPWSIRLWLACVVIVLSKARIERKVPFLRACSTQRLETRRRTKHYGNTMMWWTYPDGNRNCEKRKI